MDNYFVEHVPICRDIPAYLDGDDRLNAPQIVAKGFDYSGAQRWYNLCVNIIDRLNINKQDILNQISTSKGWDSIEEVQAFMLIELEELAKIRGTYLEDMAYTIRSKAFTEITDDSVVKELYPRTRELIGDNMVETMSFNGANDIGVKVPYSKEALAELEKWYNNFSSAKKGTIKTDLTAKRKTQSTNFQQEVENDELDSEILKFLSDGRQHTAEEMQARIKILRNVTMQRVFGALRRLTNNNSIVQITENDKKFYYSAEALYNNAAESFKKSKTAKQFEELIETFTVLIKYNDSEEYIAKCRERVNEINYKKHSKVFNNQVKDSLKNWKKALAGFEALGNFRDSVQKAEECRKNISRINDLIEEMKKKQRAHEDKLSELKIEYEYLYPYAGQTEELEKKKAQAEAQRRVVVSKLETKSKERQSILIGFIPFLMLSLVMIFATAMADFSFMLSFFVLLLISLTVIAFSAYNDSSKQTAALKAEYDTACENITQFEKQLAEAKKPPTFEKFCTDKGIDESENIAEKINNLKG